MLCFRCLLLLGSLSALLLLCAKPTTLRVLRLPRLRKFLARPQCPFDPPQNGCWTAVRQDARWHMAHSTSKGIPLQHEQGLAMAFVDAVTANHRRGLRAGRVGQESDQDAQAMLEIMTFYAPTTLTLMSKLWAMTALERERTSATRTKQQGTCCVFARRRPTNIFLTILFVLSLSYQRVTLVLLTLRGHEPPLVSLLPDSVTASGSSLPACF